VRACEVRRVLHRHLLKGGCLYYREGHSRREATASESKSPKVHYREGYLSFIQIKLLTFALFRCTSAELYSFC
jgi:hypothetical protein